MKMNHSQSAGYIETRYSNNFFEMSEEALLERYKKGLAKFSSGEHIKDIHDDILNSIEKAVGSLFGKKLGVVIIESLNKRDNYALQLGSDDVAISPNYVMHNGKPFIVGPYVQQKYTLKFIIHIPTMKGDVSELRLYFIINAIGEEEWKVGNFYVTSSITVNASFLSPGDKLEYSQIQDYVKGEICQHIEKNKVKPFMKSDVKAFNELLSQANQIMFNAE